MATDLIRKVVEPVNRDMMTLRDMVERFWEAPSAFYPWRWVDLDDGMDRGMPEVGFASLIWLAQKVSFCRLAAQRQHHSLK